MARAGMERCFGKSGVESAGRPERACRPTHLITFLFGMMNSETIGETICFIGPSHLSPSSTVSGVTALENSSSG